jgi:hypothetical protein
MLKLHCLQDISEVSIVWDLAHLNILKSPKAAVRAILYDMLDGL